MNADPACTTGVGVFYSYSHVDEELRSQLEVHLALLRRQGVIREWHDRKLLPGADVDFVVDSQLETADIILLLVSPDFLASDYCYEREMARALERHRHSEAVVIPIILRPVDFGSCPFSGLLALPTDAMPVTTWPNRDEAWLSVARGIRSVCESRRSLRSTASGEAVPASAEDVTLAPQESDLGILDFAAELESAMELANDCMNAMNTYTEEVTAKLTAGTEESLRVRASAFPNRAGRARQIANSMAAAIASYAKKLENTAGELHEAWGRIERYLPQLMTPQNIATAPEQIPELRTAMSTAQDTLRCARESALGAIDSVADLGKLSGALRLGTSRAQDALHRVANEYWRMEQSLQQLVAVIDEAVVAGQGSSIQ